jgi:hypothetical protein
MEKILASGGKEVLIKSVAHAIPTFLMSCFRLPKGLCSHINSILRNFWWESKKGKRKTVWVSREDMMQPKNVGGMGFWDIKLFNLALLVKQAWPITQDPTSLSARILKAVYFPKSFFEASLGSSPSQVWRAIFEGRNTLSLGMIKRIGNEENMSIWDVNWIPRDYKLRPICSRSENPLILGYVS